MKGEQVAAASAEAAGRPFAAAAEIAGDGEQKWPTDDPVNDAGYHHHMGLVSDSGNPVAGLGIQIGVS